MIGTGAESLGRYGRLVNDIGEMVESALLSLAISPKTEADRERLARGVTTLNRNGLRRPG